ncbi:unnamed protein product [Caenorhabditis angaria]|uniref:glucuronosyltransferase n=1 Tax=Caenorhabditis angaria TaxID=860376 RepID=A0A9P1IVU5_9PELO|nr:unnamed protein product [Caenorhabditis angaria]
MKFLGKLADLLADAGHDVTVLQYYIKPMNNTEKLIKNKKVEIIHYFPDDFDEISGEDNKDIGFWDDPIFTDPLIGSLVIPKMFANQSRSCVQKLLQDDDIKYKLQSKKFDAVIAETFEISGFYVAHLIGVKSVIAVMTSVRFSGVQYLFGQPNILGYVPGPFSKFGKNAGFWDRLNDAYYAYFESEKEYYLCEQQHEYFTEGQLSGIFPHWTELVKKSTFYIINSNPYLDFAVPSSPNMIYVGGMTIDRNKKKTEQLSEEYLNILNERSATVLISFGTVVRAYAMPDSYKLGLIEMFKAMPNVTFIFKYEQNDEMLEKVPKNVYLKNWIPQTSILADKRVKLFITHGGLGSTMEVAYSGIPSLMIPLFSDQFNNAMMLSRHGGAITYNKFDLPKSEKLIPIVKDMVENEKYKINALKLLDVLLNQPNDPKVTVLKHIEFAVKFPNFKTLAPDILSSNFIGFYYLDVFSFVLVSIILIVFLIVKLISTIISKCLIVFGFSHVKFLSKIADTLSDAGHNVTVLQYYHLPMKNLDNVIKNKNVKIIHYFPDNFEELKKVGENTFPQIWDGAFFTNPVLECLAMPNLLAGEFEKMSTQVLRDKTLHETLRNEKFDAVIVETFDTAGFYMADILNIPPIAVFSAVTFAIRKEYGEGSTIGYLPKHFSRIGTEASIFDRWNDFYRTVLFQIGNYRLFDLQHKAYSKAVGYDIANWRDLITRSTYFFVNANPYLDFAMPKLENIVNIGGFTVNKNKTIHQVSEEYENILNERSSTVLVSFGSVVRSYEMPEYFKKGLVKTFESLPNITFIWKYEKDDYFKNVVPSNVYLKKWIPQAELLGDKRVKLFITHGGLGSTMEVAYAGKPALMVPLFGDQFHNSLMLERHGGAVAYSKFDLPNHKKLTSILQNMIDNPKYDIKATELLNVLKNQPIDPKEVLIKHMEFAVKFPNLRSLIPEISKTGFISYYFLDIGLIVISLIIFTLISVFYISRFFFSKIVKIVKKEKTN